MDINKVYNGNSIEILKQFPDNSIDAIVTDPPYGLGFMGKEWDRPDKIATKFNDTSAAGPIIKQGPAFRRTPLKDIVAFQKWFEEMAIEFLRVLKPGGYILSFGGTRTYHRMACAIEDAGFEIRDQIQWLYGSGFPKSLNIGKAIDKLKMETNDYDWEGWGTALKPANEPIVVARKPLEKGLNVAQNVLKWGTGGMNIDGCRIETEDKINSVAGGIKRRNQVNQQQGFRPYTKGFENQDKEVWEQNETGRFPANIIHDGSDEVLELFPNSKSTGGRTIKKTGYLGGNVVNWNNDNPGFGDDGSAARFFYCAKTSKSERNKGCEHLEEKNNDVHNNPNRMFSGEDTEMDTSTRKPNKNHHPTVKPIKLMQYLVKLVSRKGGLVLDPFGGSGTTGIACVLEGMNYILIEQDKEYCEIAESRIKAYKNDV